MSHNLVPFEFSGVTLTVIADDNGDPEFEATSLCELLGYSNPWDAVRKHVKECDLVKREVTSHDATGSARKTQRKNFLKERGMWRLVMKSEAPNADAVQDWIAGDVLPSIRKTGGYTHPKAAASNTALDKLRTANALKLAEETAARICSRFANLGDSAKQVIYAKIINPIVGDEVLMLPTVTEKLLLAGDVAELLGVTANRIGRLANKYNLKTDEYGESRLGQSEYSSKQVEVFHYNAKAVEMFRMLLADEAPGKVVPITGDLLNAS